MKSADKIVDLLESLGSDEGIDGGGGRGGESLESDKESEGGSWRRPLKSSTMIGEGGSGFGGGGWSGGLGGGGGGLSGGLGGVGGSLCHDGGGDTGQVTRKVKHDANGNSNRGDRPHGRRKEKTRKGLDDPLKPGPGPGSGPGLGPGPRPRQLSDQENELLDEIFFLR